MPLFQVDFNSSKISDPRINLITEALSIEAAPVLSCKEGGKLLPEDMIFEVRRNGPLDRNAKDIQIKVWVHDYPSRRARLKEIRQKLSNVLVLHLPEVDHLPNEEPCTWYVWVFPLLTSYGSDNTDPNDD